jgi:hypothetical protein
MAAPATSRHAPQRSSRQQPRRRRGASGDLSLGQPRRLAPAGPHAGAPVRPVANEARPALLAPGDSLHFTAISADRYRQLHAAVAAGELDADHWRLP